MSSILIPCRIHGHFFQICTTIIWQPKQWCRCDGDLLSSKVLRTVFISIQRPPTTSQDSHFYSLRLNQNYPCTNPSWTQPAISLFPPQKFTQNGHHLSQLVIKLQNPNENSVLKQRHLDVLFPQLPYGSVNLQIVDFASFPGKMVQAPQA